MERVLGEGIYLERAFNWRGHLTREGV